MRAKNKRKFPKAKKAKPIKAKLAKHVKVISNLAKSKAMVVEADAKMLGDILVTLADYEIRLVALEGRGSVTGERGGKGDKGDVGERGQEGQRGEKGSGFWG